MRSTYGSSQRERSRERTGREGQYSIPRDTSPDDPYRNAYSPHHQFAKRKRVKFNDQEDVRVFRKEDEPIAKSLSEEEIFLIKKQIEKEVSRIYDFNWDQKKHFDALSEQNSMKEVILVDMKQKQKEKELYEKLMGMKEEIEFYPPYALALQTNMGVPIAGSESVEKQAHAERTRDVLGCYYTQINEIPNEPIFEVPSQSNKSQPKVIFFNPGGLNEGAEFVKSSKSNERELKSILKAPVQAQRASVPKKSVEREISPRLLWLLKDMQVNKEKYNKEMTEMLLKPYKETGELEYWMTNQEALNEKLKNQPVGVPPPPSNLPVVPTPPPVQPISHFQPGPPRMSPSPTNEFRPQFQQYDPIAQKVQKFKTVPCKFFHGIQGCVKTQNCTFIHDEQYRGVPHPLMLQQQFRQYPGNYESRGGYQGNQGFQRRENFQNFGGYQGHNPTGGFHQNKPFHQYGQKKFDHYQGQPGGYQQGGYNPQQPRHYQNYGQQGQQGQMNQPNYPPMNQQMGQQMGQGQQPMPGYQGYPNNPQQNQQQPHMYYGQGQMGGNMQQRNPNEK